MKNDCCDVFLTDRAFAVLQIYFCSSDYWKVSDLWRIQPALYSWILLLIKLLSYWSKFASLSSSLCSNDNQRWTPTFKHELIFQGDVSQFHSCRKPNRKLRNIWAALSAFSCSFVRLKVVTVSLDYRLHHTIRRLFTWQQAVTRLRQLLRIKHFYYITMERIHNTSKCLLKRSQHQVLVYTHSHTKQKKRNLYNIWMHITRPLKRNIFTGLWHRTLPTLHSMSALTHSSSSSSSRLNSSQLAPYTL